MTLLNDFSTVFSLLIAIISLLISIVALKIARQTFIYSSKDFIPHIKFNILKDESIELENSSRKLYQIDYVNYIKIITLGFEDYVNNTIVEIPFVVNSIRYGLIDKIGEIKSVSFNFNSVGPCAYMCPYDEGLVKKLKKKIADNYSMSSNIGYASPSLHGVLYIIEGNSMIYKQEHMHGLGFDKTKLSTEMLNSILNKSNIPKFNDIEELWTYVIKRFSVPIEKYFSN
jgi:hypothetical protein